MHFNPSDPLFGKERPTFSLLKVCQDNYSPYKLDDVFCTYYAILDEIIKDRGDNSFQIPHLQKLLILKQHGFVLLFIGVSAKAEELLGVNEFTGQFPLNNKST